MSIQLNSRLSFWEDRYLLQDNDYTILGAGIVGLTTAIELKQMDHSLKVLVIDKKILPIGASTRNAGFACFGSVSEIIDDIDTYGESTCKKIIAMRWRGLALLKDRVSSELMSYRNQPGNEIFESKEQSKYYIDKIDYVNAIVEDVIQEKSCFTSHQGHLGLEISNPFEGSIDPQRMMAQLELEARKLGIIIIQGIDVTKIDKENKLLLTAAGSINFKKLIVCTNGFSASLLPDVDIQPARNQVIITKPIPGFALDGCYHMHQGYVYFREVDNRLLLGGGRHIDKETETTTALEQTDKVIDYLKNIAKERILKNDNFEIDKMWSGILGVGQNKMPIVMQVDDNITIAIRMGGMGIAVGSYIGRLTASILLSRDNSDRALYVND